MKLRFRNYAGLAAIFLAGGLALAHTEEPARQRGTPIIFSEPKSDTVSSNLNQLDSKTSPFKGLESDLKKPFEIFDSRRSIGNFRPPSSLIAPSAAPASNRRIKELIDKRAEMMLLGADSGDPDWVGDDPFKTLEDTLDASGRKPKTPLDRYYNRLDRERAAFTNEVRNTDLFGNNKDADGKDQLGGSFLDKFSGGDRKASGSSVSRLSTNATANSSFFADPRKPKSFDDLLGGHPNNLAERNFGIKETRLDEFKRLLDRPAYAPSTNLYSPSLPLVGAVVRPAPVSSWPAWSSSSVTANPRESFTGRVGLVGAPPELQNLPSFAVTTPSLNPMPAPVTQPKPPTSTFSLPKRQF